MKDSAGRYRIWLEQNPPEGNATAFRQQHYYLLGIDRHPMVELMYRSAKHRLMIKLLHHNLGGARHLEKAISTLEGRKSAPNGVACYTFDSDFNRVKFSIDASDTRWIADKDALDWCDLYFKTNYWPSHDYTDKVRPLINGNGSLTVAKIRTLRSLRKAKHVFDIVYWTKIWEPNSFEESEQGNIQNLVEHQIRVFETLAQLPHRKSLLAILPQKLRSTSLDDCRHRLESAGIRCQFGWGNVKSIDLWQALASARVVPLRPGNHLCISWRLVDLLCMGACVMYDGIPFPQWHQPLNAGKHYIDGGCRISAEYAPVPVGQYETLRERVASLLENETLRHEIRTNAMCYFDTFAKPTAVTEHILHILNPEPVSSHLGPEPHPAQ